MRFVGFTVALMATAGLWANAAPAFAQGRKFNAFGERNPKPGAVVTDFTVTSDAGKAWKLSDHVKKRPVLIVVGSCT